MPYCCLHSAALHVFYFNSSRYCAETLPVNGFAKVSDAEKPGQADTEPSACPGFFCAVMFNGGAFSGSGIVKLAA